jgi:4-hydroxysphinganine ceramide fatty acyl 2-hydroxylase
MNDVSFFSLLVAVASGAVLWTFLEYVIHRWLGHDKRTMPNFFSVEHTRHHSEGGYFAPSWKKALAALGVYVLVAPLAVWAVGLVTGLVFAGSFVAMYVLYEVVHRRSHTHAGFEPYGRYLRRHHFHHHFTNPKANHGVTTPVWDVVFRTLERPQKIRVPEKLCMDWLRDEATGEVAAPYAPYYELQRPHRAAA